MIVVPDEDSADLNGRPPTVLDRLVGAGIDEARARVWITSGGARVDCVTVVDPDAPAPALSRVVLHPA